jgi:GMP synthase (glutamine-hydrolysing)
MSDDRPALLVVQHVPWEGPHRILDAFDGVDVRAASPLDGDRLPDPGDLGGALLMGGPMNVDETDRHPGLVSEREWLAEAIGRDLPVLGVCLGAQLLARALGAEVRPGGAPEIGFAPIRVHDRTDPIVGPLAPETNVLHWHGDVFDLPPGAIPLASSDRTEHQAFRAGNAWGLLFHPEADPSLIESWLAVPEMAAEAEAALGAEAAAALRQNAATCAPDLIRRSTPGFRAFAEMVAAR